MTDPYADGNPFADVDVPGHDDAPTGVAGAHRAPMSRVGMAVDAALRSPRWDQARGLILLGSTVFVAMTIALVTVLVVATGAIVLLRTLWEAM